MASNIRVVILLIVFLAGTIKMDGTMNRFRNTANRNQNCDTECQECKAQPDKCYIGQECYKADASPPNGECLKCLPDIVNTQWSFNPECSAGTDCYNELFLGVHLCNEKTIQSFYVSHDTAVFSEYNFEECALHGSACQSGFFLANNGEHLACCPGYFCPQGQICMIPCRVGSYCPSPLRPHDGLCLTDVKCPEPLPVDYGKVGCGGSSFEGFCPGQSYCPNPIATIKCNGSSTYCPTGVIEPLTCHSSFRCADGRSHRTRIMTSSIVVIFTMLVLFIIAIKVSQLDKVQKLIRTCLRQKDYDTTKPSAYFIPRDEKTQKDAPFQLNIHLEQALPRFVTHLDYERNKGFTSRITAGRLTALMGGSGCGKSSLLDTIQGNREVHTGGNIRFGQHSPLTTELSDYIAFVPQTDTMHADLTVFETVFYSARTRRLTENTETIKNDVAFVLDKLGLKTMHNKLTANLSGGQKKRVNIALEIAACPKVLLLDEPTSGLDTVACDKFFDLLKLIKYSKAGPVAIVMVIHQPSQELFQQIDDVIFLTAQCCIAYQGLCSQANVNLHNRILKTIPQNQHPKRKHNDCDACFITLTYAPEFMDNHNVETETINCTLAQLDWKIRVFLPFFYLLRRTARQIFIRSPVAEALYCSAYTLFGLCIGYLFENKRETCNITRLANVYFMMTLSFGITTCVSSQRLFGVEITDHTFKRESRNYFHPFQYWLAKTIVDIPRMILYPLLFVSLLYIAIDPRGTFNFYLGVMILLSFVCSGIGQFTSVLFERTEFAYLTGTLVALLSCLLSGFSPTKKDLGTLAPAVSLSFSRHGQHLLFRHESNVYLQNNAEHLWSTQVGLINKNFEYNDAGHPYVWLIMIGFILRALTLLVLYGKSEYRSKTRARVARIPPGLQKLLTCKKCSELKSSYRNFRNKNDEVSLDSVDSS